MTITLKNKTKRDIEKKERCKNTHCRYFSKILQCKLRHKIFSQAMTCNKRHTPSNGIFFFAHTTVSKQSNWWYWTKASGVSRDNFFLYTLVTTRENQKLKKKLALICSGQICRFSCCEWNWQITLNLSK